MEDLKQRTCHLVSERAISLFIDALMDRAALKGGALSINDIHDIRSSFMSGDGVSKIARSIYASCSLEKMPIPKNGTRYRHLDRMVSQRFCALFDHPDETVRIGRHVVAPLMRCLCMLLETGREEWFRGKASEIVDEIFNRQPVPEGLDLWKEIHSGEKANDLVDDLLTRVAPYFEDYGSRRDRLVSVINLHSDFQGDGVRKFSDIDCDRVVSMLYSPLRSRSESGNLASALGETKAAAVRAALASIPDLR